MTAAADGADDDDDDGFLDTLKRYGSALDGERYGDAVGVAPDLLRRMEDNGGDAGDGTLKRSVLESYATALFWTEDWKRLLEVLVVQVPPALLKESSRLQSLQLYAMYRLEQYDNVRKRLRQQRNGDDAAASAFARHLETQTLFRLYDKDESLKAYSEMLASSQKRSDNDGADEERTVELQTNYLSVLGSDVVPYGGRIGGDDDVEKDVDEYLKRRRLGDGNNDVAEEDPYDLAYNLATLRILTDGESLRRSRALLRWALRGARAAASGDDEMEVDGDDSNDDGSEVAPIAANLEWSRAFWNGSVAASKSGGDGSAPPPVQSVRQVNTALSKPSPTEGLELLKKALVGDQAKKWTPTQQRIALYDRAVLELRAHRYDECRASCDALVESVGGRSSSSDAASSSKKKKKQQQKLRQQAATATDGSRIIAAPPPVREEDRLWWESRVSVLEAYCRANEDKSSRIDEADDADDDDDGDEGEPNSTSSECVELLQPVKSKLEQLSSSPTRDRALCYVLVHEAELAGRCSANDTLRLLQTDLPESIRSRPAVIATAASAYRLQENFDEAERMLLTSSNLDGKDKVLADFALSLGEYDKAAKLYEKVSADTNDPAVRARLVQALSHIDPVRAKKLWSEMESEGIIPGNEDDEDEAANGAELELRELPRLKTYKSRKTTSATASPGSGQDPLSLNNIASGAKSNKKSRDAVLRRRERKREEHLAKLEEKGLYRKDRPVKPDPERWLPKYERSYSRRRRHNARAGQQHKGAQGGVSEKEMAKLDVAARQAARASGELEQGGGGAKSTAHLTVSSDGRGGGGGKAGRRR